MTTIPTRALWRVLPEGLPGLLHRCPRCDTPRTFRCTGRFRVNANKRRLDVWLIYSCEVCKATRLRPVHERIRPEDLAPERYRQYLRNDLGAIRELAFEPGTQPHVDPPGFRVEGVRTLRPQEHAEVRLLVPYRLQVRLDRVLCQALGCSRSQLQRQVARGELSLTRAQLRRPVKDGLQFVLRHQAETE